MHTEYLYIAVSVFKQINQLHAHVSSSLYQDIQAHKDACECESQRTTFGINPEAVSCFPLRQSLSIVWKMTSSVDWQANEWSTGRHVSVSTSLVLGPYMNNIWIFLLTCILRVTLRFLWLQSKLLAHPAMSTFFNIYVKKKLHSSVWHIPTGTSADGCGQTHWGHMS